MAVDYLSALNSRGSGLNITQIVGSLVDAEIVPKRTKIEKQIEENDLSVSEIGKLRAELAGLSTSLSVTGAGQAYDARSASSAIAIAITDASKATAFDSNLRVTQLAAAQVVEYSGFSSALSVVNAGTLQVSVGGAAATTLTVSAGDTISDIAAALDDLDGVSASVVATGTNAFSLVVKSEIGAAKAITITPSGNSATAGDLAFNLAARTEKVAAADAVLTLDGITITRGSNVIDDLVPGATLTLTETMASAARVQLEERQDIALAELKALVERLNETKAIITEATRRGVNGAPSGPLVGDPTIMAIGRRLAAITTQPIVGFAADPVYLSQIGVRTQRDGTLEVDEATFNAAYANNRHIYRAVFQSLNQATDPGISVRTTARATPPPGVYAFDYVNDTTATLNGTSLITRSGVSPAKEFYAETGPFAGVTIRLESGVAQDTTVMFGRSVLQQIRDFADTLIAKTGDITQREQKFSDRGFELDDELTALEDREASIRERYFARFTAMEQIVTRVKGTGEYMQSIMDAWNKQD
jgi:flagellar hook-associated protein 2